MHTDYVDSDTHSNEETTLGQLYSALTTAPSKSCGPFWKTLNADSNAYNVSNIDSLVHIPALDFNLLTRTFLLLLILLHSARLFLYFRMNLGRLLTPWYSSSALEATLLRILWATIWTVALMGSIPPITSTVETGRRRILAGSLRPRRTHLQSHQRRRLSPSTAVRAPISQSTESRLCMWRMQPFLASH